MANRSRPISRATASADKFAADPPETNVPPAEAGMPARSAIQRSTWFSATIAPDASSQEQPCSEAMETTVSNSRAALVGAAGMNPKNRGLSVLSTLAAMWVT